MTLREMMIHCPNGEQWDYEIEIVAGDNTLGLAKVDVDDDAEVIVLTTTDPEDLL